MSEDRGDELSDANKEFLLYQNAMAELGGNNISGPNWYDLARYGFQTIVSQRSSAAQLWIKNFTAWAEAGDPMAIALLTKVMELRLRG